MKLIYTGDEFPEDTEEITYIAAKVNGVWYRRKIEWLVMPYGPYKYLDEWEKWFIARKNHMTYTSEDHPLGVILMKLEEMERDLRLLRNILNTSVQTQSFYKSYLAYREKHSDAGVPLCPATEIY